MTKPQPIPIPLPVAQAPGYKPILSARERRAYAVAHRILATDLKFPEYLCPGTRRSKAIEAIAAIVMDEMS